MKKIYLLPIVLFLQHLAFTQTTTTYQKIATEEGTIDKQHLVAIKDCFLCKHGDVQRAFRFGYGNIAATHQTLTDFSFGLNGLLPSYFLEYEQKIASGFSINTQLKYTSLSRNTPQITDVKIADMLIYQYKSTSFNNTALSIESRWYINKNKQIQNGQSGDNLNGAYLGLLLSHNWWEDGNFTVFKEPAVFNGFHQELLKNKGKTQLALLNLGWQKHFKDNGFFNFQLGTGVSHNSAAVTTLTTKDGQIIDLPTLSKWKWLLNYQVSIGAVIGKRSQLADPPNHFFEYYEAAEDMWKIDLFNLFQGLNEKGAVGQLEIAYERKINHSAFSIEGSAQYLYSHNFETNHFDHQFALQVAPRFYYRLKKDTQKGKAANNLSTMYFSLPTQWYIGNNELNPRKASLQYGIAWGAQERLFKYFFYDTQFGLNLNDLIEKEENSPFFFKIRLGFAF